MMADFSRAVETQQSNPGVCLRAVLSVTTLLAVAACGQVPATKTSHGKIDPVWGVEAPKKKVADGEPVPPGGGRYQVGKPYMVGGRMYFPREQANYSETGLASWYGSDFHGRETANGEVYDKDSLSAAHTTLPIPSYARVTNLDNGRSILVRINDRGPYVGNRLIDVSEKTADLLGFKRQGLSHVRVQYVSPAPVEGSDQRMLVASLRGPGTPASIAQDRTLIARADRTPSDGRMTALAAANLAPPVLAPAVAPKPIVLAAAIEGERPSAPAAMHQTGFGPQRAFPPPPARPQMMALNTSQAPFALAASTATPQRVPSYPTPTYPAAAGTQRSPLPPNTLGTLSARSLVPSSSGAPHQPVYPASRTLAPLDTNSDDDASGPLQLSPAKPAAAGTPAPGAIARLPAQPTPSRYGPAGQNAYRVPQSQGFAAEPQASPAASAIDRLIAANLVSAGPGIRLGSYANPDNAARVADLMRPYGEIRTADIRGGLGERLIAVELRPSSGFVAGDVISIADHLGIHSATLVD